MGFNKSIAGKIKAGNQHGRSGKGASRKVFRWPGTIPTAYWRVQGAAADATTLTDASKAGNDLNGT